MVFLPSTTPQTYLHEVTVLLPIYAWVFIWKTTFHNTGDPRLYGLFRLTVDTGGGCVWDDRESSMREGLGSVVKRKFRINALTIIFPIANEGHHGTK